MVVVEIGGAIVTFFVLVYLVWFNKEIKELTSDVPLITRLYFVIVSSICWMIFLVFAGILAGEILVSKKRCINDSKD